MKIGKRIKEKIRNQIKLRDWIKRFFDLHDIKDLQVGGHCGCCGKWIMDQICLKEWSWGLCEECRNE